MELTIDHVLNCVSGDIEDQAGTYESLCYMLWAYLEQRLDTDQKEAVLTELMNEVKDRQGGDDDL